MFHLYILVRFDLFRYEAISHTVILLEFIFVNTRIKYIHAYRQAQNNLTGKRFCPMLFITGKVGIFTCLSG